MSKFPHTRLALARLLANLSIRVLPETATTAINGGYTFVELIKRDQRKQAGDT